MVQACWEKARKLGLGLVAHGAELNYIAGTAVQSTDVISELVSSGSTPFSPSSMLGVGLGWNYLDGLYAVTQGMKQLMDKDDYRQTQMTIKGLLNIFSGIQLFALSYNPALTAVLGLSGGAALAAPSFALATLCDLATASIDCYNASIEHSVEGWLEEKVKEYEYKIAKGIDAGKLLDDILVRARVYYNDPNNAEVKQCVYDILNPIIKTYDNDFATKELFDPTKSDKAKNTEIQKECDKNLKDARLNLVKKVFSFIGMTLLAIAPFVMPVSAPLIIGVAVIIMVALSYAASKAVSVCEKKIENNSFFADKSSDSFKGNSHGNGRSGLVPS